MKMICYGDSNTWGYDPRGHFGGRYDSPWPELLAEKTGWEVLNHGENGREIPGYPALVRNGGDLLIVMLGTNDLLQGRTAAAAGRRMETFLKDRGRNVLLIAPPPLKPGAWVSDPCLIASSKELARRYRALSERLGIPFADAGAWNIPLAFDGVHFTQEGHRAFAEAVADFIRNRCGRTYRP